MGRTVLPPPTVVRVLIDRGGQTDGSYRRPTFYPNRVAHLTPGASAQPRSVILIHYEQIPRRVVAHIRGRLHLVGLWRCPWIRLLFFFARRPTTIHLPESWLGSLPARPGSPVRADCSLSGRSAFRAQISQAPNYIILRQFKRGGLARNKEVSRPHHLYLSCRHRANQVPLLYKVIRTFYSIWPEPYG